jgi:hypothetical protein
MEPVTLNYNIRRKLNQVSILRSIFGRRKKKKLDGEKNSSYSSFAHLITKNVKIKTYNTVISPVCMGVELYFSE